jgi:transcriptional regulator
MKNSKAFILIQVLTENQRKALSNSLKSHKRDSLKKLFQLLCNASKDEPEATEVFKKLFKQPYNKAKDYLLRNEYRLLYDYLLSELQKNFIEAENEVLLRLRTLLKMKAYDLFEAEYKLEWAAAHKQDNVEQQIAMLDLYNSFLLEGKMQNLHLAQELEAASKQRIQLMTRQMLRNIRKEEIRLKLAERIQSAYHQNFQASQALESIDLLSLEKEDKAAQFYSLRAKANISRGEEKINLLLEILAGEEAINLYEANPKEAQCRFLINVAQEYYLLSNYKKAVHYYEAALSFESAIDDALRAGLVLNFILARMRNAEYDKARILADEYNELLLSSPILVGRSAFLLAVLYLYANQPEQAIQFVNLELKNEGSEFNFFMRLVLSIIYYQRKDKELALRECVNLEQAVNYQLNREHNHQTVYSKQIILCFKRFYTALDNNQKTVRQEEMKRLKTELEESLGKSEAQHPNSVLTQWLLQELK